LASPIDHGRNRQLSPIVDDDRACPGLAQTIDRRSPDIARVTADVFERGVTTGNRLDTTGSRPDLYRGEAVIRSRDHTASTGALCRF